MTKVCKLLGVSKSWYYDTKNSQDKRQEYEQKIISKVLEIRKEFPEYGTRRIWKAFERDDVDIGRDQLGNILRKHNLLLPHKLRKIRTSIGGIYEPDIKNLIKGLEINRIHQVIYTDITYVITTEGILYLSAIMDAYSRKILSISINDNLRTDGSVDCLMKSLKEIDDTKDIIHHSDRGCQYTSHRYRKILSENGILCSFTGTGRCYDNPYIERFFRTIKYEYKLGGIINGKKTAIKMINNAVKSYNYRRLHSSLGYRTPNEVYCAA